MLIIRVINKKKSYFFTTFAQNFCYNNKEAYEQLRLMPSVK